MPEAGQSEGKGGTRADYARHVVNQDRKLRLHVEKTGTIFFIKTGCKSAATVIFDRMTRFILLFFHLAHFLQYLMQNQNTAICILAFSIKFYLLKHELWSTFIH